MTKHEQLAVIVPTRGRPEAAQELINEFYAKAPLAYSTLVFGVDEDDPELSRYEEVFHNDFPGSYVIGPRLRMNGTLNFIAPFVAEEYKYIGFMGDDHRPRTEHWDYKFIQELEAYTSIAYGNDLIQGVNLPTAVFMTSDIVETLGYMAPPELTHLYLDNFWKDLGEKLEIITYHDKIIIEHLHPSVGKAEWDEQYKEVNAMEMYNKDCTAYSKYKETRFAADVEKIRELL